MSDVFIIVDFNSICRFCLESKGVLSSIFDTDEENSLILQIMEAVDVEVFPDDDMPAKICHRCRFKIEQSFEFKKMIQHSQKALKDSVYDINKECSKDLLQVSALNEVFIDTYDKRKTVVMDYSESQEFCNSVENKVKDSVDKTAIEDIIPDFLDSGNFAQVVEDDIGENRVKLKNIFDTDEREINLNISQYPSIFAAHKKNQCLLCLERYSDEESLYRHVDDHVKGTDLEPYYKCKDRNIYCKVCCRHFGYRFRFLIHQREHLDLMPFACLYPDCGAAYFSNAALKQHTQCHADKQFICATCGVGFKRKQDLRGHEIIHEDADKKYRCALCGLLCKNRITYGHHVKKHHAQPKYKCDHCPKEYFNRSELTRHLYSHSSIKKFQCDLCSCAYFSQSALKRHIRCHDQPKMHKCFVCAVVCSSWSEFMDHRKLHASEQCPFQCPYCNKGYFLKPSLTRHMTTCLKKKEIDSSFICVNVDNIQQRELISDVLEDDAIKEM